MIRFLRRPAPVETKTPEPFAPTAPIYDEVDLAADCLCDVPAQLVGTAIYARLCHPLPKGGKLSSEQLYEISNKIGRLAHAKAREEDARRDRMNRVMARVRAAISAHDARTGGQHDGR